VLTEGRKPRIHDTWIAATALVNNAEVWTQDGHDRLGWFRSCCCSLCRALVDRSGCRMFAGATLSAAEMVTIVVENRRLDVRRTPTAVAWHEASCCCHEAHHATGVMA
jgi:hypothetical protein